MAFYINSRQPPLGCTAMNESSFFFHLDDSTASWPQIVDHMKIEATYIHGWSPVANLLGMGCHNCQGFCRELKFKILSHAWIICHTTGAERAWFSDMCRVPFPIQYPKYIYIYKNNPDWMQNHYIEDFLMQYSGSYAGWKSTTHLCGTLQSVLTGKHFQIYDVGNRTPCNEINLFDKQRIGN